MEFTSSTLAILVLFISIVISLLWQFFGDWDDLFDDDNEYNEYWEDIDRDDEDDEPKSQSK